MTEDDLRELDLQGLIAIVYEDWPAMGVTPRTYLDALDRWDCRTLADAVGNEDAETQVRYFLSFAGPWRGAVARAVKAELRRRLKSG